MRVQNKINASVMMAMLIALCGVAFDVRADGKQVFIGAKCNKCHEGAGIALLPKDPAAEGEEEDAAAEKVDPPKLDGIGAKVLKEFGGSQDAVMTKLPPFLRKEVANSKGKKHKKKATITDDQYKELIPWLLKL